MSLGIDSRADLKGDLVDTTTCRDSRAISMALTRTTTARHHCSAAPITNINMADATNATHARTAPRPKKDEAPTTAYRSHRRPASESLGAK
jgi:hypothetical protein